ncbi:MAG: hypothetical protein KTR29_13780 [Rhodothermaceae bacterium]|nr:hypothetical protein [Rhodothermaceae bacterium]
MPSILVYLPNISTDLLIEFMTASLGDIEPWVGFKKLGGKTQFRAPELSIELQDSSDQLYISVIKNLIATAKSLGATQFTLEKEGYSMQRQPTDAAPQRIENILIAFNVKDIEQINIY